MESKRGDSADDQTSKEDGIKMIEEEEEEEGEEEGGTSVTSSSSGQMKAPAGKPFPSAVAKHTSHSSGKKSTGNKHSLSPSYREVRMLNPAPYFYYVDHSRDIDDDPLSPLSPAISVPNFVIKLHAILIREDLSDVIAWMPHGRSWKILNETEFERHVRPMYFNQGNIASFYRQANGWGFRRLLKGPDKGSFYNDWFLRGLTFLAKKMKRIGGAKIVKDINITNEPVLWKISAERPVPAELSKNSVDYIILNTINQSVQEGGPKAKMPFVHNIVSHTHGVVPAHRDMSMSQVGLMSDTSSSALARSRGAQSMRHQDVNNSNLEALLQQQRLLQMDHQRYDPSIQQLQGQSQNPLISSLLLNLMMNGMAQSTTNHVTQQIQAPWQQHPQQANPTVDNINSRFLDNTDGFSAPAFTATTAIAPNATEPPSSLQGVASIARLLGTQQTGNAASIPQPRLSTNNYVDSNQRLLYLMQQANQGQGQVQSSLMNSVLQNLLREQLQQQRPNMLPTYFNSQPTMSQPTYNPSNQQLLYAAPSGMANLSQPLQYAQQSQPYQLSQQGLWGPQLSQYQVTNQTLQQPHQQLQQSSLPSLGVWGSSNQLQQQQLQQHNTQGQQQLLDQPQDDASESDEGEGKREEPV